MAELLFARLSPDLRLFAIRKLGRFAAETSLASMHEEVKTLASAAARGDAAAAVEHVLLPLLRQLVAELPSVQSARSGHLSKVCLAFLNDLTVHNPGSKALTLFQQTLIGPGLTLCNCLHCIPERACALPACGAASL
jgi:hypothetical protein